MSDDFPTFDRPAKAICGLRSTGNCFGPTALMTNSDERIFMDSEDRQQRTDNRPKKGQTKMANRFLRLSSVFCVLSSGYAIFSYMSRGSAPSLMTSSLMTHSLMPG